MTNYIGWKIVREEADDGTLLLESPQGHRRRVLFNAWRSEQLAVELVKEREEVRIITGTLSRKSQTVAELTAENAMLWKRLKAPQRRVYVDRQTGEWVLDRGPGRRIVRFGSKQEIQEYLDWMDAREPEDNQEPHTT